jgi:hypothetical protein
MEQLVKLNRLGNRLAGQSVVINIHQRWHKRTRLEGGKRREENEVEPRKRRERGKNKHTGLIKNYFHRHHRWLVGSRCRSFFPPKLDSRPGKRTFLARSVCVCLFAAFEYIKYSAI